MPTKAKPQEEPLEEALSRIDFLMARILEETSADAHLVAIGGEGNYRNSIYPAYKANRIGKPRPTHLATCKNHIKEKWDTQVTIGIEADDLLGIEQNEDSVICSIDKDLLQIPGRHYNFVKQEWRSVDALSGLRSFYKQVITGDASDNVPGFDGALRTTTPQFVQALLEPLELCFDEDEMYRYVRDLYGDTWAWTGDWEIKLHTNAQLLFIQRKERKMWEPPFLGQTEEKEVSL
jgi:hypothetical protein